MQAHHPIQNEWTERNVAGYKKGDAPAILLKSASGEPHAKISSMQRNRRRVEGVNTGIRYEFNKSYEGMIEVGVDKRMAKKAMKKAYKYFDGLEAFE